MRTLHRLILIASLLFAGTIALHERVEADPSIGDDAGPPLGGVPDGAVLEPAAGAPTAGATFPPAPAVVLTNLLSLPPAPFAPGAGDVDDFSYGNDFGTSAPVQVEFSVAAGAATGHPLTPPPPIPLVSLLAETGIEGGFSFGDIFTSYPPAMTVPPPFGPPPACGPPPGSNAQILDGDGLGPAPRLGLNVGEGLPVFGIGDIDAYDRSDSSFVDTALPLLIPDAPVYFTVDPVTAGAWPFFLPLPNAFGPPAIPGPADIIAWDPSALPFPTLVIYAFAGMLGLGPGDDIDGLAVSKTSGLAPSMGFAPPDIIFFSLALGSPSLSPTSGGFGLGIFFPEFCFAPGVGTAGDVWMTVAPGVTFPYRDAEMLGLNTVRTGFGPDDDLDALDFCNGVIGSDMEPDGRDDYCDYDVDGDGIGNDIDADDDGDGTFDPADPCSIVPLAPLTNSDSGNLDSEMTPPPGVTVVGGHETNPHEDVLIDACDLDDDNDGLQDVFEPGGCNGSGALSPTDFDTDDDLFPDGYECTNGTNPGLATSRPPYPPTGALDSDGDGVLNSAEIMILTFNGAGPANFDGDACSDGRENASVNADTLVTSGDLSAVAVRFGAYRNTFVGQYTPGPIGAVRYQRQHYDFNRDATISSGDLSAVASRFTGSPAAPC